MAKVRCGLLLLVFIRITMGAVATSETPPSSHSQESGSHRSQTDYKSKQKYPDSDYCKMNEQHLLCNRKGLIKSFHLKCQDIVLFPREEVRVDLDSFFNQLRNTYALGEWPGDSFPVPIPNMQGLEWDDELADLAEAWMLQCPSGSSSHVDVGRFKVAQIFAFSTGKTFPTTQLVLAELLNDNHTFHIRGPAIKNVNVLYTATSQYDPAKPMPILTNPHMKYFGCAVANMKQKREKELKLRKYHKKRGKKVSTSSTKPPSSDEENTKTKLSKAKKRAKTKRPHKKNKPKPKKPIKKKPHKPKKSHKPKKADKTTTTTTPKTEIAETTANQTENDEQITSGKPNLSERTKKPKEVEKSPNVTKSIPPHDDVHKTVIVCNFGPVEEPYEKVQKVGQVCSSCPENTTCHTQSSYPGLCLRNFTDQKLPVHHHHHHEVRSEFNSARTDNKSSCSIICDNGAPHTLCQYSGTSGDFDNVIPVIGETTINYILVWHNLLRDNVASGKHNMKIPLAADMREMVWNKELEKSAMLWASQCSPHPDQCRDIRLPGEESATYVNQLVTRKPWSLVRNGFPSFEDDILSEWGTGFQHITAKDIEFFDYELKNDPLYAHFAQLIWAQTYMIGCAMTLCRNLFDHNNTMPDNVTIHTSNTRKVPKLKRRFDSNLTRPGKQVFRENSSIPQQKENDTDVTEYDSFIVAVCNYAPGGGLEGDPIYSFGGPCTKCQKIGKGFVGTRGISCSHEYYHLCSENLRNSNKVKRHLKVRKPAQPDVEKDTKSFQITTHLPVNTTTDKLPNMTTFTRGHTIATTLRPQLTSNAPTKMASHKTLSSVAHTSTKIITSPRVDDSCKITHQCFDEYKVHTLCKYKGISKFCKDHDLLTTPLSSTRFLNLHNELRGLIANGDVDEKSPFIKFPRAGNMRKMIWDSQLETSAKEWVFQCIEGTDECRDRNYNARVCKPFLTNPSDVPNECFLRANQLVAWKEFDPTNGTVTPSPEDFFKIWVQEVRHFDPFKLVQFYEPDKKYDNFAQLIWARTFLVGCVYVTYYKHSRNVSKVRIARLVCNYAPAGLQEARSVYRIGGACTLCEKIYKRGNEGLYCSYPFGLCDVNKASPKRVNQIGFLTLLPIAAQIK